MPPRSPRPRALPGRMRAPWDNLSRFARGWAEPGGAREKRKPRAAFARGFRKLARRRRAYSFFSVSSKLTVVAALTSTSCETALYFSCHTSIVYFPAGRPSILKLPSGPVTAWKG